MMSHQPGESSNVTFVFMFFLAGLGTVASYAVPSYSSNTTILSEASQIFLMPFLCYQSRQIKPRVYMDPLRDSFHNQVFPKSTGLATGVVTALFGLSPLFLSAVASTFLMDHSGELDAPRCMVWLAVGAGVANFVGSWGMARYKVPM